MASVNVESSFRGGHRRNQSVMAQQFSTQLDDLFNMDSGLDTLVQDVESKRQSIFVQQRELEELQERIRQAELRLGTTTDEEDNEDSTSEEDSDTPAAAPAPTTGNGKAPVTSSPPSARPGGIRRTYSQRQTSIFAIRETKDEEVVVKPKQPAPAPAAAPAVPAPGPKEYVMVRRPRPAPRKNPRVDSHIEITDEEEEEEEDDSEEDEESSEEEQPVRRAPVKPAAKK